MATTKAFELAQLSALADVTTSDTTLSDELVLDGGSLTLDGGRNVQWGGAYGSGFPALWGHSTNKQIKFAPDGNTSGMLYQMTATQLEVNPTTTSTTSTSGALVVAGGAGIAENLNVGGNIVVAGTLTGVTDFNSSGDMSVGGDLTVTGDLTVEGSQVSLNTTALDVEDKNITLNYHASNDTSASADGAGITIQDAVDASNDASILWDAGNDEFDISHSMKIAGSVGVTNIVTNKVVKFNGTILDDSNITDTGTKITLGTATDVSGQLKVIGSLGNLTVGAGANQLTFDYNAFNYINSTGAGSALVFRMGSDYRNTLRLSSNADIEFYRSDGASPPVPEVGMHWDYADGRLGIGTDTPGAILDVNDAGVTDNAWNTLAKFRPDLSDANAEASIHIQSYPSTTVVADRKAGIQSIDDAGDARALILNKDGGNVGIGTDSPDSKLTVNTATTGDGIELQSSEVSIAKLSRHVVGSTVVASLDGVAGRPIHIGGAINEKVILAYAGGNVGIGNDLPIYDLDVTGQGRFTTDLRLGSENLRLSTDGSGEFGLGYGTTHTTANRFRVYQNTTPVFSVRDDGAIDTTQVRHSIRPTLNLDFANSKELDSRITFYRDSIATYYDSKGVLKYANVNEPRFDHDPATGESKGLLIEEARTNIVPDSTHFGTFSTTRCVKVSKYGVAPDGTLSALYIGYNGSAGSRVIHDFSMFTPAANSTYAVSCYAKSVGNDDSFSMELGTGANNVTAFFDLSVGTATTSTVSGTMASVTHNIEDVGNGWYRCVMIAVHGASWNQSTNLAFYDQDNTDAQSGILVWAPQVEAGAFPTSYIPSDTRFTSRSSVATYYDENGILRTAPVNGARYGYKYDGRKWVETGLILEEAATNRKPNFISSAGALQWSINQNSEPVANDTVKSPDDSYSTIRQKINSTANAIHSIYAYTSVTAGTQLCFSVYAKAAEYNRIYMYTDGIAPTIGGVFYDLSNGTIGGLAAIARDAYGIEDVGNGWYRCWYSGTPTSGTTAYWHIDLAQSDNTRTFVGTVGQGLYLWGPQMEYSGALSSYIYTDTSAVTRAADVATSVAYTREDDAVYIDNMQYSNWYNREEGTYYIDLDAHTTTDTDVIVLGQAGYPWILYKYLANQWKTYNGNNSIVTPMNSGINPFKGAISFGKTSGSTAQNGTAVLTNDANLTQGVELSNMSTLDIGYGQHANVNTFNGTIKKLSYYPTEMTSAELVALTENN